LIYEGIDNLLEKYRVFLEEHVNKELILKSGKKALYYSENARKIRERP
jgi:hypothetical protein